MGLYAPQFSHRSQSGGVVQTQLAGACGARARPRAPAQWARQVAVVGGQAPKAIRSVDALDVSSGAWRPLADLPMRRCRSGVCALNGLVYAVGGFNGSLRVRSVDAYDPARDQWTPAPNMDVRRATLGVAVLEGAYCFSSFSCGFFGAFRSE